MSRLIMFCSAAALMAMLATAPAAAESRQYTGTTTQVFTGGEGGFPPHRACFAKFKGVWCTSQMIIENGPHEFAPDPPADGAWVNPAPVGMASPNDLKELLDFSGTVDREGALNCVSWDTEAEIRRGLVIVTKPSFAGPRSGIFKSASCADARPAACCGGQPFIPFFFTGPPDPPR